MSIRLIPFAEYHFVVYLLYRILSIVVLSVITLSVVMLSDILPFLSYIKCHNTEYSFAYCRHTESHHAECGCAEHKLVMCLLH